MNKRLCIILLLCIVSIGIITSFLYKERIYNNNEISYESRLNGQKSISINVNNAYIDEGATEIFNGQEYQMKYSNTVDTSKIGVYFVEYSSNISVIYPKVYREVRVCDHENPKISLKGNSKITLYIGDKYIEPGYTVTDNYDTSIENKVHISGTLDTNKVGHYRLIYSVIDSSNNRNEVYRDIIVKKKNVKSPSSNPP